MNIQKQRLMHKFTIKNVIICPSQDLESCHNDWNTGFISFIDSNKIDNVTMMKPYYLPAHSIINMVHSAIEPLALPHDILSSSRKMALPFASNGSFIYCSNSLDYHSKLVIGRMGHPRFEKTSTC